MTPRGRALLIGWGNSTPTQLAAYERLYAALGVRARSVIPDTRAGLVRPTAFASAMSPVAAELAADAGEEPLMVHLFSDNGFIGWSALLRALAAREDGARVLRAVRGIVLDSSPGLWNVRGRLDFARRFALGMTPLVGRKLGLGARERVPVITRALAAAFVGYQVLFPRAVATMRGAAEHVTKLEPRCPHLFLYGGQDVLVRPEDVRAWIARERARGIDVEEVFFERGKHVALYPCDPRRYREALDGAVTRWFRGSA